MQLESLISIGNEACYNRKVIFFYTNGALRSIPYVNKVLHNCVGVTQVSLFTAKYRINGGMGVDIYKYPNIILYIAHYGSLLLTI